MDILEMPKTGKLLELAKLVDRGKTYYYSYHDTPPYVDRPISKKRYIGLSKGMVKVKRKEMEFYQIVEKFIRADKFLPFDLKVNTTVNLKDGYKFVVREFFNPATETFADYSLNLTGSALSVFIKIQPEVLAVEEGENPILFLSVTKPKITGDEGENWIKINVRLADKQEAYPFLPSWTLHEDTNCLVLYMGTKKNC